MIMFDAPSLSRIHERLPPPSFASRALSRELSVSQLCFGRETIESDTE